MQDLLHTLPAAIPCFLAVIKNIKVVFIVQNQHYRLASRISADLDFVAINFCIVLLLFSHNCFQKQKRSSLSGI